VQTFLQSLKKDIRDNLHVSVSLDCTSSDAKTKRQIQHFSSLKFKEKDKQSLYETVLTHALKSELSCPGSGIEFLKLFSGTKTNTSNRKILTKSEVRNLLVSSDYKKKIKDIMIYLLDVCEENTRVSIKKSSNEHTSVEESYGYVFRPNSLLLVKSFLLEKTKIACVDGYIESVSEIHHLLTALSESKTPAVLFCRGMSNDVLHTIKVNNDRKTIILYPFVVPFDVDNVNMLVDIAVATETDVVSSTKGDLISSFKVESLGNANQIVLSSDCVTIRNSLTTRVKNHLENLKKTIEERRELEEILSKRIRSLTSSCIEISLPDDINFYHDSQQLDEAIRMLMSCIRNTFSPIETAEFYYQNFEKLINDSAIVSLL
jgi:chaperonin GroEL (HSP60 family)